MTFLRSKFILPRRFEDMEGIEKDLRTLRMLKKIENIKSIKRKETGAVSDIIKRGVSAIL